MTRKISPTVRRVRPFDRTVAALKQTRDLRRMTRRSVTSREFLWLSVGMLLTPSRVIAVVRFVLLTGLGLDRFLGRDWTELLFRAADILLKLFCGGLPGILEGCFEGLFWLGVTSSKVNGLLKLP